jgi:hypothetical protein
MGVDRVTATVDRPARRPRSARHVPTTVTRVAIDLGSGEVRRGALLGASATVQEHAVHGWRALSGAEVAIRFTPLSGRPAEELRTVTDMRGVARFAARHHESGTWSVHVDVPGGTPASAARLVVVRD